MSERSIIENCIFGHGIVVREDKETGRAKICVCEDPIGDADPKREWKALRLFMEEIAVQWLEKVAPHRLNHGLRASAEKAEAALIAEIVQLQALVRTLWVEIEDEGLDLSMPDELVNEARAALAPRPPEGKGES
jgi:hypothetical protein